MITSPSNERVKLVRALQAQRRAREREGRFVVEGVRLLATALDAGAQPDLVLHAPAAEDDPRAAALLARLRAAGAAVLAVSASVLRVASATETPAGLLAVVPIPAAGPDAGADLVVVADGLRDPGNLGTLLRTAAAAGAGAVLLAPGTVDAYNPKTVRAGMGAHFQLAVHALDWAGLAAALAGRPVWLAAARGGLAPWDADLRAPLALLVGGEAEGASAAGAALASGRLTIPLARGVESLNAAGAAAMLLYEVMRQNRGDG
jgi:TrmH family RNA methyltransferase